MNRPVIPAADAQLLRRIADGDEQAFDELYQLYSGPIYSFLVRLIHEPDAAEDLMQEVFVAAWQGARRFREQARVKTWLLSIAHNQAVSWLRRFRPVAALDDLDIASDDDAPEESAFRTWQADQVQLALRQLSPNHRAVVELAFVHGLSYSEIAQVVGCPVGTVKSRMSYAFKYLNGVLRGSGVES